MASLISHRCTPLLMVAAVLLASACASKPVHRRPRVQPQRPTRIEVGMTKPDVEAVLGRPHDYAATGPQEIWRYYKRDGDKLESMTIVRFREGLVESFDTGVKPPPNAPVHRPELRQPAPGANPHLGKHPPGSHAPGGHEPAPAAPPRSSHPTAPGDGPSLRPPAGGCAADGDCPSGKRCFRKSDGTKYCK